MMAALRLLLVLVLLAVALAPVGLHLGVIAPLLVQSGHRAMAVVSLVGAVAWFALWLRVMPLARGSRS